MLRYEIVMCIHHLNRECAQTERRSRYAIDISTTDKDLSSQTKTCPALLLVQYNNLYYNTKQLTDVASRYTAVGFWRTGNQLFSALATATSSEPARAKQATVRMLACTHPACMHVYGFIFR
jgi:hypothetical protein